jgi:hypothetical protein
MKNIYNQILCLFFFGVNISYTQSITERYNHLGKLHVIELKSAPFPHPERSDGLVYQGKIYSIQQHYNDSRVVLFIPRNFEKTSSTNLVIYFHGWFNNVDSACTRFKLVEQFSQSNLNAIFVFPEGPKNAPDSHGGKLQEKDGLKNLVNDVLAWLVQSNYINSPKIGRIILAGHSGAYRVISFCLKQGGLTENISDVILFDALYDLTENYLNWIKNDTSHFISIYTDSGGTKTETENLMNKLDSLGITYFKTEEMQLKEDDLTLNRLIFIHTDLSHNEVIEARDQFQKFLKSSKIESVYK